MSMRLLFYPSSTLIDCFASMFLFVFGRILIMKFNEFFLRRKTRIKSAMSDRHSMRRGSVQSMPTSMKREQEV